MTKEKHGKHTAGLIGAWFIFTLLASALHLFRTDPSRPAILLGLAALTPSWCSWCGLQRQKDSGSLQSL